MSQDNEKRERKKRGGNATLIICGVVIVGLVITVAVMAFKMKNDNSPKDAKGNQTETTKRNVVVTPDNVDEVIGNMNEDDYVAPGSYEVTMNTTWNFSNGSSASENAYVGNSTSNTNDVYFDITLADTGENIYSSPVIPVGSHLENIALDKKLDKGSYDCVVTYTLVDKDQNSLSTVRVSLTINVEQ